MFKRKRVFISGGAGVIGTELVRRLHDEGAILLVGDLKPRPREWPRDIRYRQGDLNFLTARELDEFAPEIFFHLAATFERSTETYGFWDENFRHNVGLSHHLMTLLKDSASLRKVVFASSYLIYDKERYHSDEPVSSPSSLRENTPVNPRNLTGCAKLSHEIELNFLRGFKGGSLQVIHARIFRSYGLASRDVISRWVRALLKKETLSVFNKENTFDFVFAGDVAEGLLRLAKTDANGVVNIGTGASRSVADVLAVLQTHFPGMRYKEEGKKIAYEASQADTTLLRTLTGWAPTRTLEDVIPAIIAHERKSGDMHEPRAFNVLITSISRKVGMIKAVRAAMEKAGNAGRLVGGDGDPACIGRHFTDAFWRMPRTEERNAAAILAYSRKNAIGLIIPSRDGELAFWAGQRKKFAAHGIHVSIADPAAVRRCVDKLAFFRAAQKHRLPVIPTSDAVGDIRAKTFVVKERFGAGSRSIALNVSKEAAVRHAATLADPVYQPFVSGKEYSVDCYVTKKGTMKGCVVRERTLVVNGESQVTVTVRHPTIEALCGRFAAAFQLRGHSVLQLLVDARGGIHILECNARFGGASTAAIAAGLDSFYWLMLEAAHNPIDNPIDDYPFLRASKECMQVRFPDDLLLSA